ncbi:hypothetical protein D0T53_11480 [Dysgonomonas sp. 216]|uniref:hypothetical protein n=1 Tax=Dysgonomonas sp. 216 TaxID=2302934 RepID=UPI0013D7BB16|nr:hypothetical protein [Dysgonomonas sp. 216]NDW19527.1 hypothetical protein [Dysgonomonas sp. 216]
MSGNKKLLLVAILAFAVFYVNAQNTTSPYSRHGYGMLKDKAIGTSKGMGGISYGVRGQSTNPGNPASYSAVDSLTFIFDMGVSFSQNKLSDGSGSQSDDNGGLDYITMLFPVSRKMGVSFGILPYSSTGYSFKETVTADGITEVHNYSGSGNLSQVFGGLSYEMPIKGLSVGANVSYMFGTLKHNMVLSYSSVSSTNSRGRYQQMSIHALKFDIGAQYEMNLPNNKSLVLGAVFSPQLSPKTRVTWRNILSSGIVVDSLPGTNVDAQLPATYGLGFTYSDKKHLLFGADVTYQKWSDLDYPGDEEYLNDGLTKSERFNDRIRVNAGIEYVKDPLDRNFFKRLRLRGGLNYSNSYMNVKSNGVVDGYKEYGATIGFGIPISRDMYSQRVSFINLSFEYTKIKPDNSAMVKEDYFGVSLNMNINELWFMKNKFR